MKKILLLLALSFSLFAQTIHWYDDFDEAKAAAKKSGKPMIVMITTSWCKVCNMMKHDVYTDKKIAAIQSQQFINVMYDKEFDDVPKQFPSFATPTFYFLNSSGEIKDKKIGGSNIEGWLRVLKKYHTLK